MKENLTKLKKPKSGQNCGFFQMGFFEKTQWIRPDWVQPSQPWVTNAKKVDFFCSLGGEGNKHVLFITETHFQLICARYENREEKISF